MTEQEIDLALRQLEETLATPGWTERIAPAIDGRIRAIERRVLDAESPPDPETYRALLRERADLAAMRDIPAELVRSLRSNRDAAARRPSGRYSA